MLDLTGIEETIEPWASEIKIEVRMTLCISGNLDKMAVVNNS